MDPVAFTVFGWSVRWYGILLTLGILAGIIVVTRLARKRGLNEDNIWTMILWAIPVCVLCSRIYYVIFQWEHYAGKGLGEILAIWHGGLAIHGTIIGGILTVIICCRYYKMNFFEVTDCFAPGLILGQAIGRWGNFANGEAHGTVTDLPWAINVDGAMVHPTFLYESLWDLGIFILLMALFKKDKERGNLILIYLMLYSVGRFFIEGLRTDSLMIGPLRQAQVISIVLFAIGLLIYLYKKYRERKTNP
ncbi:MAG: prolipoprotein diacylglyceryl transferase [Bacillota bacterium]|nr:prolipoprotein diacylglyceryl transferase [Bacillota bacterium]